MAETGRFSKLYIDDGHGNWLLFAGVREKGKSHSVDSVDNSGDDPDGYQSRLPSGRRAVSLSLSGVAKGGQAMERVLDHIDNATLATCKFEGFEDVLEGDFHIGSWEESAPYQDAITFSASFQSANAFTWYRPITLVSDQAWANDLVDFSRASEAWFWNSSGLLEKAAVDTPRWQYDPATGEFSGLLTEQQAKNSLLHNRDPRPSGANWSGTATVALDATGADGVANKAATITDSDGAATQNVQQNITIGNNNADHAIFWLIAKDSDTSRFPLFNFQLTGGTPLSQQLVLNTTDGTFVEPVSDGDVEVLDKGEWWLVYMHMQNNSSGNTNLRYQMFPAWNTDGTVTQDVSATGSIIYDFGQVELQSLGVSSPIETGASAVTRSADDVTAAISGGLNNSAFSYVIEARAQRNADTQQSLIALTDAAQDNRFFVRRRINGTFRVFARSGGTTIADFNTTASVSDGADYKIAVTCEKDNFAISINGGAVERDSSGVAPDAMDTRYIGQDISKASLFNSTLKLIRELPRALTDQELQTESTL